MKLQATFHKYQLRFRFDAGTSRGIMTTRMTWFIQLWDKTAPANVGFGEAAPLDGLSLEKAELMDGKLKSVCELINSGQASGTDINAVIPDIKRFPSIIFALETAFHDLKNGGRKIIFDNDFSKGKDLIPINGLVWMGNEKSMTEQIEKKIREGYSCIKMKIGAIDFNSELNVLRHIRNNYTNKDISIRLDANGAFAPEEAMYKLEKLSALNIHSIEQPIRPGSKEMEKLCLETPVPIALDEELIGHMLPSAQKELLERIHPQYIILKPSLLGGLEVCERWKNIAATLGISWWITSALESNIGLNAIAQWTAQDSLQTPQGLGTGQLYHNNIESPLYIKDGHLGMNQAAFWQKDIYIDV